MPGGSPEDFTAIGQTSTSVQLRWDAPAKKLRHGEIILYEVVYHRVDNALEDFAVNTTDTSVIVDGLDEDADYIFQLRAYTVKGSGPWTSRLPFKTFANRSYYFPPFYLFFLKFILTVTANKYNKCNSFSMKSGAFAKKGINMPICPV